MWGGSDADKGSVAGDEPERGEVRAGGENQGRVHERYADADARPDGGADGMEGGGVIEGHRAESGGVPQPAEDGAAVDGHFRVGVDIVPGKGGGGVKGGVGEGGGLVVKPGGEELQEVDRAGRRHGPRQYTQPDVPTMRPMSSNATELRILTLPGGKSELDAMLRRLRLDAADLALLRGERAAMAQAVAATIADVAARGDAAIVEQARRFDDPEFSAGNIVVTRDEMAAGHARVGAELLAALRHSIRQVREYQRHILPGRTKALERPGFSAVHGFSPVDSAGLYFPGGKASYPSSLIMLAVPAEVAGVGRIVACTPPSRHFSDAVLAVAHELKLRELYRVGGVAAIAAMALGTETIAPVDKIVGPGNTYVQLAKRAVSGAVGVDGFLGPSEIVVVADESADPATVAADLLAQAEHDPGTCFLLTTSAAVARNVSAELAKQTQSLPRREAIERSLADFSVAVVCPDAGTLFDVANAIACEHVSLRVRDVEGAIGRLRHAGCVFVGEYSPVAAGDYVAGPSHCLPTNTTARFAGGVSVYEFLKRSSRVTYGPEGIAADAPHIAALARAEGLEAHARSAEMRVRR